MPKRIIHPELELKVKARTGASIENACAQAIKLARKLGVIIVFDFNSVECHAYPTQRSDAELFVRNWNKALIAGGEQRRQTGDFSYQIAMSY